MCESAHSVSPAELTEGNRCRISDLPKKIAPDLILIALLITYFLHFALQSLSAHFAPDDMMNMWGYWHAGWSKVIGANLCFWSSAGRPLGAIYYLPLHSLFDLDPKPYRVVTITLVAATIPVAYLLGRSLSSPRSVAFLAVFGWSYQLANLVFVTSFIYDVLCTLFYLTTLAWYVGVRQRGRFLRPLELLGCFALYICALNSKEMAVTLPVVVLVYELLKYYHESERRTFLHWIWHNAWPALGAGLITAIYCYNKIYGPHSWAVHGIEAYTPHYSWSAFATSNAKFVSTLFYLVPNQIITAEMLLAMWALAFLYAFLRGDRMLQLMAFWVVITPLPLAFVTARGALALTIILFGWAMILSKLVSDFSLLMAKVFRLRNRAVFFAQASVTLLVVILLGVCTERQNRRYTFAWLRVGEKTAHVIEAFRALNLQPSSGSKVLLTDNPFGDRPDTAYISQLLWNDHSLTVYLEGKNALSAEQLANMDYILAVHEYKIDVIRGPR